MYTYYIGWKKIHIKFHGISHRFYGTLNNNENDFHLPFIMDIFIGFCRVLFPGGGVSLINSEFAKAGRKMIQLAKEVINLSVDLIAGQCMMICKVKYTDPVYRPSRLLRAKVGNLSFGAIQPTGTLQMPSDTLI